MKIEKILEHYMAEHGEHICSVERTRSSVKYLTLHLGRYDHTRLTPGKLRSYRAGEGLEPASINRDLTVLQSALLLAVKNGLIRNTVHIQKRAGAEKRVKWLRPQEIKTLIAAAETYPETRDVILMALWTVQRLEALLSLRWTQVDREQNVIWFTDHGLPNARRRKGRGDVPITPELGALLDRLQNDSPFVLVNRYGTRFQDINRDHWRAITEAAGLEGLVPHDLRHTAATNLIRAGVDLLIVSRLLGHRNTKITEEIYIEKEPELLTAAVGALGRLVA